jgi:hypothetical protein
MSVRPCVCLSVRVSVCPSVCPSVRPGVCLSVRITQICTENQNTYFVFRKFLLRRAVYDIMWNRFVKTGRPQMGIWRMRNACWISHARNTRYSLIFHYQNGGTNEPCIFFLRTLPISTHIPFFSSVQAAGCCSFPNKLPAVHRRPPTRRCTNLPFTMYLQTQIRPIARLRVSAQSRRHSPRHCCVHLLTVLTHYIYWEKVSSSTVNMCDHTWINEMSVQSFKIFVNFYCWSGKCLAILPPYYARTSQTNTINVLNRNSVLRSHSSVSSVGPERILGFVVDKVALGQIF